MVLVREQMPNLCKSHRSKKSNFRSRNYPEIIRRRTASALSRRFHYRIQCNRHKNNNMMKWQGEAEKNHIAHAATNYRRGQIDFYVLSLCRRMTINSLGSLWSCHLLKRRKRGREMKREREPKVLFIGVTSEFWIKSVRDSRNHANEDWFLNMYNVLMYFVYKSKWCQARCMHDPTTYTIYIPACSKIIQTLFF